MTEKSARPSLFRSLRVRNYRLYATGSIASNTGTWMQRIAQDWLVLTLTDNDPVALGFVTFLQFAPSLLFAMFGGLIADRYDKRTVLRVTQTVVALSALILGLLEITDVVAVWHVLVLATVVGVATAIEAPSRQAFASELVGPADLVNAVGLNSASFNAARLIGPAIAGVLIGWLGTGPVFILNAASSVWIIVLLTMIDPKKLFRAKRLTRQRGQLKDSIRYVRTRPDILLTICLVTAVSLFGLNLQVIIPLVTTEVFHKGATEYGLLASALAIGTLIGSLTGAGRQNRPRFRQLVTYAGVFGLLEVGIAFIGNYNWFAIALIPTGMASLYFMISANASVQLTVDPQMRGRVMAMYMMFLMGGGAFGSPLIGFVTKLVGIQWAIALGGGVTFIAAALIGLLVVRREGGVQVETSLHSSPHLLVNVGGEQFFPHVRTDTVDDGFPEPVDDAAGGQVSGGDDRDDGDGDRPPDDVPQPTPDAPPTNTPLTKDLTNDKCCRPSLRPGDRPGESRSKPRRVQA
ncbi:putative MFS family arabinose efflux permease [Antricoccus suffuscus]|uniref:Putative MFS family arabinose efflux permease n=1 Tax=Antricoccus suffuscus TaxID=1629062 RepID=A0A2T0ZXP8_9ACTN|nr:MFS transporter [Antricoccus suffuscus]PRZ41132.1 putative MFS family arabinose efflux permease [Antricoccus suffuscus]